jgi:hypothetical protein
MNLEFVGAFVGSLAKEMPHPGGHREGQLRAAAEADVGSWRREHLDLAGRLRRKAPGLHAGLREFERPLGERAASPECVAPPQPHVHGRPIHHHADAAERPHRGRAEREHAQMQPRRRPHLDRGRLPIRRFTFGCHREK